MANYKETDVAGTKYRRAKKVTVDNPLNGVVTIKFFEEDVINIGDEAVTNDVGLVSDSLINPAEAYTLYHPQTGAVIGMATYEQLYVMMYSLYFHLASKRDNPPVLADDPPNGVNPPIV